MWKQFSQPVVFKCSVNRDLFPVSQSTIFAQTVTTFIQSMCCEWGIGNTITAVLKAC